MTTPRLTQYAHGGGCACKIPPGELERIVAGLTGAPPTDPVGELLVGLDTGDDAAVVGVRPDLALVATADFFTPVVDDPYDWGRIAAANALSDVYAMGGKPVVAVNLLGWPREVLPLELAAEVLRGGRDVAATAGCHVAGGHSVDDPEPKYGMAVTGIVDPARTLRNDAGRAGLPLSLTKPLGIGVLNTRHKATGEVFPPPSPPGSPVPPTSPASDCWATSTSWCAPAVSVRSSTPPPCPTWTARARPCATASSAGAAAAIWTGCDRTPICPQWRSRRPCC